MAITRFGIVMAGGAGERFWPLSRRVRPKQLLSLVNPAKSMLEEAVERLLPLIPPERLYVITGRHLVEPIRKARVGVPDANVLGEPGKKNTSGALAFVMAWIMARHAGLGPEEISLAVTTADHRIGDDAAFRVCIDTALRAAECHDALVVCGIAPTRPETGFGYIEIAPDRPPLPGFAAPRVFEVRQFHEKPDRTKAEAYLASGRHLWNSGMFFWRASTFLSETAVARNSLHEAVQQMTAALRQGEEREADRVFDTLEDISIDYALMERAQRVLVVCGAFPWADVGAWPALLDHGARDAAGNLLVGGPAVLDSTDCIIYNAPGAERMAVGVIGLRDTVVVVTEDAVLVMPKDNAQDVRKVVEALRGRGASQV